MVAWWLRKNGVEPYNKCPFSNHQSQQRIQILEYHIYVDAVTRVTNLTCKITNFSIEKKTTPQHFCVAEDCMLLEGGVLYGFTGERIVNSQKKKVFILSKKFYLSEVLNIFFKNQIKAKEKLWITDFRKIKCSAMRRKKMWYSPRPALYEGPWLSIFLWADHLAHLSIPNLWIFSITGFQSAIFHERIQRILTRSLSMWAISYLWILPITGLDVDLPGLPGVSDR